MGTARRLEAEWRQVLSESVSAGVTDDESNTGRIWATGFHHFTGRSRLEGVFKLMKRFETHITFVSLIFPYLLGCGKPRILNQLIYCTPVELTSVANLTPCFSDFLN
jgi:hypothetical protein